MTEQLRCILKDNWHYLKIGGEQYIVKSISEDAADLKPFYVVLISNFIDVWSEKVYADEIIKRNNTLNPNIEVPIGRLLSHIQQIFKSSKLSIKNKSEDEITIVSRSCLSSLPYKWEFQLHKCDRQVVADQLTFPLIAAIAELNRQNEHLVKIILVKDVQIESGETENILSKENKGFEIAAFQKEMNESAELATTVATSINTTFGKKLEPIFKSVNEKLFRSSENKDQVSGKRKSYSVEFKKSIVEESQGKNLMNFCKEKKLDLRMVRKWRAEYNKLSEKVDQGNGAKRKCGSGRQPLYPELENVVRDWVADRRANSYVVHRADIQAFALSMAPQFETFPKDFKASQHWLSGFLQRYELS